MIARTWLIIFSLLFSFKVRADIDSLKLIPSSPTENDSIWLITYVSPSNVAVLYDHVVNFNDSLITIYDCYVNGSLPAIYEMKDTVVFGKLAPGNYKLWYYVNQPFYFEVDSPQQCRTYGYYDSAHLDFTVRSVSLVTDIYSDEDLKIYPNPVNNFIKVDLISRQNGSSTITIANTSGQTLYEQRTESIKGEINTENLPPGLYFLILQNEKYRYTKKFVKY